MRSSIAFSIAMLLRHNHFRGANFHGTARQLFYQRHSYLPPPPQFMLRRVNLFTHRGTAIIISFQPSALQNKSCIASSSTQPNSRGYQQKSLHFWCVRGNHCCCFSTGRRRRYGAARLTWSTGEFNGRTKAQIERNVDNRVQSVWRRHPYHSTRYRQQHRFHPQRVSHRDRRIRRQGKEGHTQGNVQ